MERKSEPTHRNRIRGVADRGERANDREAPAFVRYADDCNVYVRSERAGERVMEGLKGLYAELRLKVNEAKSAVAKPWYRKFLGYSFWKAKDGGIKRRAAPKAAGRHTSAQQIRR